MNHAEELNRLIEVARQRADFQATGFRPFNEEAPAALDASLKAGNLFFTTSVLGMEAISHVIEDQAINLGGNFTFYSGFQKFSRMLPQQERYNKLCWSGNPINIFGIPDAVPWSEPNMHVITLAKALSLDETSLAHNWFVVLNNPRFVSMALVANEQPRPKNTTRVTSKLLFRNFEGFWTYDQAVIDRVAGILDDYINYSKSGVAR